MRKAGLILLTICLAGFLFAGSVLADSLSIRISNPKSPNNQTGYDISFVASNTTSDGITVDCLVQKPGEGGYNNFASGVNLPAGGGSGTCSTSGVFNAEGSYGFKVIAHAGSYTAEDSTSVSYYVGGPGTPTNYNKNQTSSCQYKISFHTANDSGRTSKVEIYRSDSLSFTADSGTRVGEVGIGSDQDGSFTNDVPDCGKTYYFAIRAFDASGNGSGVIGDSTTTTIYTSPSPATGALVVSGGTGVGGGQVLGEEASPEPSSTPSGQVEGATAAPTSQKGPLGGLLSLKNILLAIGVLLVLALAYYTYRQTRE